MLNVAFVDDEITMLTQLQQALDWEQMGFRVVGAFSTPQEVLSWVEDHTLDVLIADISMPEISGLELAGKLKVSHPDMTIVLLTAYQEFQYVRTAMHLNIRNFLLKPLNNQELTQCMTDIRTEIESHERHQSYLSAQLKKAQLTDHLQQDAFFQWLLKANSTLHDAEIRTRLEQLFLPAHLGSYRLFIVEPHTEATFEDTRALYHTSFIRTIKTVFDQHAVVHAFLDQENRICLIAETPDTSSHYALIARRIRDVLQDECNCLSQIACSDQAKGYETLKDSYNDAVYTLTFQKFYANTNAICVNQIHRSNGQLIRHQQKIRSAVIQALRNNDFRSLKDTLDSVQKQLTDEPESITYTKLLYMDFVISGQVYLDETEYAITDIFGEAADVLREMEALQSMHEQHDWIIGYFHSITDYIAAHQTGKQSLLVARIQRFIDAEFSNPDLSVQMVAEKFYMSQSHISSVFKSEVGTPLKRYINHKRMECARTLALENRLSVEQMAGAVGFADPMYFLKCFRKFHGMSPSELARQTNKDG